MQKPHPEVAAKATFANIKALIDDQMADPNCRVVISPGNTITLCAELAEGPTVVRVNLRGDWSPFRRDRTGRAVANEIAVADIIRVEFRPYSVTQVTS